MFEKTMSFFFRDEDEGQEEEEETQANGVDEITSSLNQTELDRKTRQVQKRSFMTGRPSTNRDIDRLPPGQHKVSGWPVLDIGGALNFSSEADWTLTIDGTVSNPVHWTFDQFMSQPQVTDSSDIHCVTSWSRFENEWVGVSAKHILMVVKPNADSKYVILHSYDGYTTNLALDQFDADDVLLAHTWERQRISREHGGPVRVVVPQFYFWKSAKWIKRIEFASEDHPGFWEVRGYSNHADPWLEERYS